jgi:hypothetical protein
MDYLKFTHVGCDCIHPIHEVSRKALPKINEFRRGRQISARTGF